MIYVREVSITHEPTPSITHGVSSSITHGVTPSTTHGVTPSHPVSSEPIKTILLNDSIAILLRSYTRAINKRYNRSGGLFRESTKAENLTKIEGISPSFFGNQIAVYLPEKEYPQVCFDYIHNNPVKAKIVANPEDYEFSSYPDFAGLRNGKLINRERANEFGLFIHL